MTSNNRFSRLRDFDSIKTKITGNFMKFVYKYLKFLSTLQKQKGGSHFIFICICVRIYQHIALDLAKTGLLPPLLLTDLLSLDSALERSLQLFSEIFSWFLVILYPELNIVLVTSIPLTLLRNWFIAKTINLSKQQHNLGKKYKGSSLVKT